MGYTVGYPSNPYTAKRRYNAVQLHETLIFYPSGH